MTFQSAVTCSKLTIETLEQRCEICPKLTIKTPKCHWRRFGVFIVNFEHISHLYSSASIVNFEQVNAGWVRAFSSNRTNILKTPNHIPTITNFLSRKSVIVDFVQNFQFKELLLFLPTLSRSSIIQQLCHRNYFSFTFLRILSEKHFIGLYFLPYPLRN